MKKIIMCIVITTFLFVLIITIFYANKYKNRVIFNGHLKVEDEFLKNQFGNIIQLKGVSSHGIQWEDGSIINYDNLKTLRDEWKSSVFRVAMYTEENGYIENKEKIKERATQIIDLCIDLNMYVVIDWHILSDNNPNIHKDEAIQFFDEISYRYKNIPNILFEICNEPNGDDVDWNDDIVPYATDVINVIRKNSPRAIVIVGTPNWSKNIIDAAQNPLPFNNIMYAFHFYSGTHGEMYKNNLEYALEKKLPVFVSEWGTSTAENAKEFYKEESKSWIELLNSKKISWINWSFSNKDEATSILKKDENRLKDENLTSTGIFIKEEMKK